MLKSGGLTDRLRCSKRKGGAQSGDNLHRTTAFDMVLLTCYQSHQLRPES